jgi:Flp pilus assembly protein TadG
MIVIMLALIALAIDIGVLEVAKTQLQHAADAAALAATGELIDKDTLSGSANLTTETASARAKAVQYAAANLICNQAATVDANTSNSTSGDVVVGYLADPSDRTKSMTFTDPNAANAVQVRVQRTAASNGEVSLFFGKIFGKTSGAMQASATAAMLKNFGGFKAPSDGTNLGILPFALDETTWNNMVAGGGSDNYAWNDSTKTISSGSDNIREMNLYPQGTGSPGNRGTVDIGSSNNSTADIARQIVYGVNASDLAQMPGGKLVLNAQGTLSLNGDTGISAGVKDELASIEGQPRVIPIFRTVNGNGNNAQYTIVGFVGIRILNVVLTGSMSNKQVIIQPANVKIEGGIAGGSGQSSYNIYSPVWLVR